MNWDNISANNIKLYFEDDNAGEIDLSMAYEDGCLYLNGHPVFSKVHNGILYWNDGTDPKSAITAGSVGRLQAINDCGLFTGVIMTSRGIQSFKGAVDTKYSMVFSAGSKTTSYDLLFGSCMEDGDLVQTLEFCEKDDSVTLAVCRLDHSVKDPDGSYNPHIYGTLFPGLKDYTEFTYFDVRIESDYLHVTGKAWKSEEEHYTKQPTCQISGICKSSSPSQLYGKEPLSTVGCGTAQRLQLDAANTASVEALFYLPMPLMENVNNEFPNKLNELMLYAISDEQLDYIGKPKRPVVGKELTQEMADLANTEAIKEFLTKKYYYACLSSLLAHNECGRATEYIRNIPNYDEKLKAYYVDSLETSMSKDPAYGLLTESLQPLLYAKYMPELRYYGTDKKQWAQRLHKYALYTANANQVVDEYTHSKYSRLQHTAAVLKYFCNDQCLEMDHLQVLTNGKSNAEEPKKYFLTYSTDFYYRLMNRAMTFYAASTTSANFILTKEDRELFLEHAGKKLLRSVYDGTYLPESLKELQKELQKSQNLPQTIDIINNVFKLMFLEFEGIFSAVTDECIFNKLSEKLSNYPKASFGIRIAAAVLAQGLMLANAAFYFYQWDKLSAAQRASTIMSVGYTVTDIVGIFISADYSRIRGAAQAIHNASNTASPTNSAGPKEASTLKEQGAKFPKRMEAASKIKLRVKIVGTLMAVFAFAISVCDIVSDLATYGPGWIYGISIAIAVFNGIAMLATVGFYFISSFAVSLVGSSCLAALLPGIGWICAAVGILLSFILFFIKRSVETLKETYVREHCVPFVTGLLMPKKQNMITLSYCPA